MKNVLLISHTVLHYRVSVYNYMWKRFQDHDWNFKVLTNQIQPNNKKPIQFSYIEEGFNFRKYSKIIECDKPDAVILFLHLKDAIVWPLIHWLKWRGIPIVFWTKGGNLDHPDSIWRKWLFSYIFNQSDSLIMYSSEQLPRLSEKCRRKAIAANNAINYEEVPVIGESAEAIKKEFELPFKKLVLFVGTMGVGGERKKVQHLIEVFNRIEGNEIGCVIVGANMPEYLQRKINPLNTRYLGSLHDEKDIKISKLFKAADIFVVPGHIGLGINQAFYWGLPVITERCNQPPEIHCLKSGKNGFLVKENDLEELKEKILYLLENESIRAEFSKCARETVEQDASIESMFKGFHKAVELAVDNSSASRKDTSIGRLKVK